MSKPFQFKHFTVQQNKTAMKVGTDGVLLGAWTKTNRDINSILDVGSGTGLIALMLAQRCTAEIIDAIELNEEAYEQSVENFENSEWGDRLFCYHASLQEFSQEIDEKYDLIVSNPPFYTSTYKELSKNRAMARHTESLSYNHLLSSISKLLSKQGYCAFIIPYQEEIDFIEIAKKYNLFPTRITRVKGNKTTDFKRSLLEFSFSKTVINQTELIIEIERHKYTKNYIDLVKDFYLKM